MTVCAAFCAMPVAKAEVGIGVGDFWEYSMSMEEDGLEFAGNLKYSVKKEATVDSQQVFLLDVSGSGDLSGDAGGMTASGSYDVSGTQTRLKADFSLLKDQMEMEWELEAMTISISMSAGFLSEYSPAIDDYIGDDNMTLSTVVQSTSDVSETSWTVILGVNESDSQTVEQSLTLTVVETNVSVTVPAGTFDCCKVRADHESGGFTDTEYWFYSEEVGNYVKMSASSIGGIGDLELSDYGGKDGGAGIFSGENLWIIILLIAVVVVVIAVVLGMRSRRGRTPTPLGQPQPGPEIMPPQPGQPPAPPGGQMPPQPGQPPGG